LTSGEAGTSLEDARIHDSQFYYEGKSHDIIIYARDKLHEGLSVPGPAIISEMDSTTVILPAYEATVDGQGNLIINPVA
jgi:N-methylhydantoinase A